MRVLASVISSLDKGQRLRFEDDLVPERPVLRQVRRISWVPPQIACLVQRLPQLLRDLEVVPFHGALVLDVPSSYVAILTVQDVNVKRRVVA